MLGHVAATNSSYKAYSSGGKEITHLGIVMFDDLYTNHPSNQSTSRDAEEGRDGLEFDPEEPGGKRLEERKKKGAAGRMKMDGGAKAALALAVMAGAVLLS